MVSVLIKPGVAVVSVQIAVRDTFSGDDDLPHAVFIRFKDLYFQIFQNNAVGGEIRVVWAGKGDDGGSLRGAVGFQQADALFDKVFFDRGIREAAAAVEEADVTQHFQEMFVYHLVHSV